MPIKSKLIVSKYLSDKYKLQYGYSISKYIFNDLKNLGIWQMIFIAIKNVVFSSERKTKENKVFSTDISLFNENSFIQIIVSHNFQKSQLLQDNSLWILLDEVILYLCWTNELNSQTSVKIILSEKLSFQRYMYWVSLVCYYSTTQLQIPSLGPNKRSILFCFSHWWEYTNF